MSYEVRLEIFEGPLDLLLQLVSKEHVDVADVSISSITEQYLAAVRAMEEIDLDLASGFLVLAATLLELKSLKLLPHDEMEDLEVAALLEERDHLLHRLIEYSTFKQASAALQSILASNAGYFYRDADLPPEFVETAPDLMTGVTTGRLLEVASRVLGPKHSAPVDVSFMTPIRVSVREMVELLAEEMRSKRTSSFKALCRDEEGRLGLVVRFLALLELYRQESVDIEQARPFDEIFVRWREPNVSQDVSKAGNLRAMGTENVGT